MKSEQKAMEVWEKHELDILGKTIETSKKTSTKVIKYHLDSSSI